MTPAQTELTPINLSDANQQFSDLVRRVENSGEGYLVLRHGRPVARLLPIVDRSRGLSPEQEAALARILAFEAPLGIGRFDREEAYAERIDGLMSRGG